MCIVCVEIARGRIEQSVKVSKVYAKYLARTRRLKNVNMRKKSLRLTMLATSKRSSV